MQIHGITRLMGDVGKGCGRRIPTVRPPPLRRSTLHCSVAPGPSLVHCNPVTKTAFPGRPDSLRNLSMSNEKKQSRIAVIPGDGIGKEVVPEGLRVLETAAK